MRNNLIALFAITIFMITMVRVIKASNTTIPAIEDSEPTIQQNNPSVLPSSAPTSIGDTCGGGAGCGCGK